MKLQTIQNLNNVQHNRVGRVLFSILLFLPVVFISAQNINTPNKPGPMGTNVNTQTGNLFMSRTDLNIPARSFDINISFSYNSFNYDQNIGYGNGWTFGNNIYYRKETDNSIL